MIQTANSTRSLEEQLSDDFILDKRPLITSAGFSPESDYAGQARQTFSLVLTEHLIDQIRGQVQSIYDDLIKDCWLSSEPLPFDMIRLDAFLQPTNGVLKVLEINTRNVGLHEFVEWLDQTVASAIHEQPTGSLNQRFVQNQKLLHSHLFGTTEPLLYMSPPYLPRWTYLEELRKAYSNVVHITSVDQARYTNKGIEVAGITYRALTKKLAWAATDELKDMDAMGRVRILQPRWMRQFGLKNYLQQISSPSILRSENYTDEHYSRYVDQQDSLVLKIIDGGNSKAVYVGGIFDSQEWQNRLATAAQLPEKWVVQDYCQPPVWPVIVHGRGVMNLAVQLGIFVLPDPTNPTQFDMDITVKAYAGEDRHFTFDPSGLKPDIWFGHVIKSLA